MIRDAKFRDIPEIVAMLHEMYAESKFRGRVEISDKAAEALLTSAIAGQKQSGPQASYVVVAEHDGALTGFMIGVLDRVYHIGTKLAANDLFLHVRASGKASDVVKLIDGYIAWASGNRKVIQIGLSWTDTIAGAEKIGALYARKGFVRSGEIWERRLDEPAQEAE